MTPRQRYLLKTYGITEDQYNDLLQRQNNACAICLKDVSAFSQRLAVEHDHKSGYIRGLACTYCNRYMIGRHRNPDILRRIADYISQHTGWKVPDKKKKRKKTCRTR